MAFLGGSSAKPLNIFLWSSVAAISAFLVFGMITKKRPFFLIDPKKKVEVEEVHLKQEGEQGEAEGENEEGTANPTDNVKEKESVEDKKQEEGEKIELKNSEVIQIDYGQDDAKAGTVHFKKGLFAEAVEFYTKAIETCLKNKGKPGDVKVMFSNRAAAHEKMQQYDNVISDCTAALNYDNRYINAFKRRARAKSLTNDVIGALADYVCMVMISEGQYKPVDAQISEEVNRLHKILADEEVARVLLKKKDAEHLLPADFFMNSYFSSFHPRDTKSPLTISANESDYSIENLTASITAMEGKECSEELKLEHGSMLLRRAFFYKKDGQYDNYDADVMKSSELLKSGTAHFADVQLEKGTIHHLKAEFALAKDCYNAALAEKKSALALVRLAGLYFDQKDPQAALEWFSKATEAYPSSPSIYYHRAQLHSISGDLASSKKDLEKCIDLASGDNNDTIENNFLGLAFMQLGLVHFRQENKNEALETLQKATTLAPLIPDSYNYLGETYVNVGNVDMAMQMYQKALSIDRRYPVAYVNMANMFLHGMAAFKDMNEQETGKAALDLLNKAIEMCPRSQLPLCHLAHLLITLKQFDLAKQHLDQAVKLAFLEDDLSELLSIRVLADVQQIAYTHLQL